MGDDVWRDQRPSIAADAAAQAASLRLAFRLSGLATVFLVPGEGEAIELVGRHADSPRQRAALLGLAAEVRASGLALVGGTVRQASPRLPARVVEQPPRGSAGLIALPLALPGGPIVGVLGGLADGSERLDASVVDDLLDLARLLATQLAVCSDRRRVSAEAAACRQREARLRAALDSLPHFFWVTDIRGRYVEQNAWDRAVFGDLVGRAVLEADPPLEQADLWHELHHRVLAGEVVRQGSWRQHPGGEGERWVETLMAPFIVDGAIEGLVGLTVDRTAEIEVERRLQASETLLRTAIDALPCALVICDATGRHLIQNDVDRADWGDAIGRTAEEGDLPPEAKAHMPSVIARVLAGETVREQLRYPCRGRLRDVDEIYAPVRTEDGITGFVGLAIDHTERAEAERRLAEAEGRLGAAIDALPFPFFICDLDGRHLKQNACDRALWGDCIGKTFAEIDLPSELCDHIPAVIERVRRGETVTKRLCYERDGRRHHEEEVYAPVYAGGVVTGFVGLTIEHTARVESERRLRESEQRLADYLSTASDWLWETDAQHRVRTLAGWPRDARLPANRLLGRRRWDLVGVDPESDPHWQAHVQDLEAHRPFRGFVYPYSSEDHPEIWIELSGNPVFDTDGRFLGYRGTARDVTSRRTAEAALREAHAKLDAMAQSGLVGMTAGQGFLIEEANDAFLGMLGLDRMALATGLDWRQLIAPDAVAEQAATAERLAFTGAVYTAEVSYLRADGSEVPALLNSVVLDGEARRWFALVQDLTPMKLAEARVRELAERDVLTGLANRHVLFDRLKGELDERRQPGACGALMMLDLDGFKEVNDTLGHEAGDRLLQVIGARLTAVVRDTDTVARVGGDEFAVVLRGLPGPATAAGLARKILASLCEPLALDGRLVRPNASIGISLFPTDGRDPPELLKKADIALYKAKAKGRGAFCFFEPELLAALERRRRLTEALQAAIGGPDFSIVLQPRIELASGRHAGLEALARWRLDEVELKPDVFIDIAEECGGIVPIGRLIRRQAVQTWRRCEAAGIGPGILSLNVAAAELKEPAFAAELAELLATLAVAPDRIEIEVTENALLDRESAKVACALQDLHDLGVAITLDDFGTGYASLTHLRRFPLDRLKIDGTLVRKLGVDPNDAVIVRSIINLAHSLGMSVVAEGVESAEQLAYLRLHGCDFAQGYFIAEPLSPSRLEAYLARQAQADIRHALSLPPS
jgi:diguanylate cyclase (GGDEF)-like protein/PAS domain S-box-containing protein